MAHHASVGRCPGGCAHGGCAALEGSTTIGLVCRIRCGHCSLREPAALVCDGFVSEPYGRTPAARSRRGTTTCVGMANDRPVAELERSTVPSLRGSHSDVSLNVPWGPHHEVPWRARSRTLALRPRRYRSVGGPLRTAFPNDATCHLRRLGSAGFDLFWCRAHVINVRTL